MAFATLEAGTESVNLCPEWTPSEVADYVATYLRVAGFCALCSGLYVAVGKLTYLPLYVHCFLFWPVSLRFPSISSLPDYHFTLSLRSGIGIAFANDLAKNLRNYRCEYV